jgi:hypothetical protein
MTGSWQSPKIAVIVVTDADAAVALAAIGDISVTASSKREPGDRADPKIGSDLAVARALRKLARRLERRANGAVRQSQHVREQRAARKSEPPGERANPQLKISAHSPKGTKKGKG